MTPANLTRRAHGDGATTTPALVGIIAAILLWYAAENLRERLPPLTQQLKAAATLVQRGSSPELSGLKSEASKARSERMAIEFRMRSDDTEQMARARLVFDLRQRCGIAKLLGCSVRLSDETSASRTPPVVDKTSRDGESTLESIGINKARAIVSGTFNGDDFVTLINTLRDDGAALWRVNGFVVRGNTFELDVERHIRPASLTAGTRP